MIEKKYNYSDICMIGGHSVKNDDGTYSRFYDSENHMKDVERMLVDKKILIEQRDMYWRKSLDNKKLDKETNPVYGDVKPGQYVGD